MSIAAEPDDSAPLLRIIGVGSPFGFDALGWEAIEFLEVQPIEQLFPGFRVELEHCELPAALVNRMVNVPYLVLVDALGVETEPGVHSLDIEDLGPRSGSPSSHGFGVAEAIRLAEAMGQLPGWWRLYGLGPGAEGCKDQESRRRLFECWVYRLGQDLARSAASGRGVGLDAG